MISVDHQKNIQRIINVIKADSTIITSDASDGLLRSVQFGNPAEMQYKEPEINSMPYVYVTTNDSIQKTSYPFGVSFSTSISQISVEYKIVLVVSSKAKQVIAEKQSYSLLTKLRDTLAANPTFKDPISDDDPIFSRSIINQSNWNTKTKGTLVQMIEFTLLATIGKFSANFPGIGDVNLLSKPNAPEGIVFSEDREQKFPNRVLTENGDFGALFVEYESTVALDDLFRAKFGVEEDITLMSAGGDKIYHIKYIDINPTELFDGIERTILHMEIVPN